MAVVSPIGLLAPINHSHKVWEDPAFIKWRKRNAHVPLRSHDTVEGNNMLMDLMLRVHQFSSLFHLSL